MYEVKVPYSVNHGDNSNDLHGHEQQGEQHGYSFDYVAHPKYEFSYGVEDHRTGDFHGQKERRDGEIKSLSLSLVFSPPSSIETSCICAVRTFQLLL